VVGSDPEAAMAFAAVNMMALLAAGTLSTPIPTEIFAVTLDTTIALTIACTGLATQQI
jgi:hypothetical protein